MSSIIEKKSNKIQSEDSESHQSSSQMSDKQSRGKRSRKQISQIQEKKSIQSSKKSSSEENQSLYSDMKKKQNSKISEVKEEKYKKIEDYEVQELEKVPISSSKKTSRITENKQYSKLSQARSQKSIKSYRQKSQINKEVKNEKLPSNNGGSPSPSVLQKLNQSQFIQNSSCNPKQEIKLSSALRYQREQSELLPFKNNSNLREEENHQSYLKDHLEEDIIQGPDLEPQTHSFHLNNSKSIDSLREAKLSFKEALQIKYEGIDAHHKEIGLFTVQPFFKNVLKSPKNYSKTDKKSFADAMSSKKSIQSQSKTSSQWEQKQLFQSMKELQQSANSNNSELLQMHEKIKQLERQKMAMQMKLAIRENQIRSLKTSSVFGSQKNLQFLNTPTESRFWPKEETSLQASLARRMGEGKFEKEIEPTYTQYLDSVQSSTFRKNLIKTKSLAYNSEQLEIGCLSQLLSPKGQNDGTLDIVLFITFHHFEAYNFTINLLHDSSFQSELKQLKIDILKTEKQYKVLGKLKVVRIPFYFPEIEVTYRTKNEGNPQYLRAFLPLSFNKFVEIQTFTNNSTSQMEHLRTNDFKLNSKNIPLEKISELLTGWTVMSSSSTKGELIIGATCNFKGNRLNIILNLSEKKSWVQGWLVEGDPEIVQFLVCTMKNIFVLKKK